MEPVTTTLTMVALKQTVTHVTKKLLDKVWEHDTEQGKELLRQLSESNAAEVYAEKYVSRFMKMRTLHSAESDVYLDEIYSPLKLEVQSNGDELTVEDGFTLGFSKVINIIGIAGQGKSTILRKLFLEEMRKAQRFPFMIELRRVENDSILSYFKQQLKDIGLAFDDGDVEILLQSRKIVLMLDGYDEVASQNRLKLLSEIIQLKTRYSCDVIVTTRPGTEICSEVDIVNLKVKSLEIDDIISIISKLDKNDELEELPRLIKSNKQLQETLISPILVNLLYVCYPYLDIVPESVVDFYDKLFITLFSRHDKIKNFNREKYSPITAIEANKVFNAFCFDSINKNSLEFTEESLYGYLQSAIRLNQVLPEYTEQIQKDLINITCLIQKDGFDKYVFLHKSVQEFHAAKFIASLPHKHKEKFYSKLSEAIDNEDKFDNVLQFLKYIDTDDYNSLLVVEYFNRNKLNHLKTDSKDVILDSHISKVLKNKHIEFHIEDNSYFCETMAVIYQKNLLSTLTFFSSGERRATLNSEELFSDHLFNLDIHSTEKDPLEAKVLSLEDLKGISSNTIINGDSPDFIVTTAYEYLQASGGYQKFSEIVKEEIMNFYTNIYGPIYEKNQQVSRILDIDFDM
ncbi:NACHT domain-containing protein [Photobacterium alginatilyticum]|uniref:NACHT domain-containing protein n=1 Tax=Photobacterium alginatilyticum TaxID=1775171 RepID=A0ABW9YRN2_9GAMM|nr:NACHT domain-containing protein [Photobacterium alginatilyticum]NBI56222.1 NACHT domain-containing protein [Photobacterium alginatilyticum]